MTGMSGRSDGVRGRTRPQHTVANAAGTAAAPSPVDARRRTRYAALVATMALAAFAALVVPSQGGAGAGGPAPFVVEATGPDPLVERRVDLAAVLGAEAAGPLEVREVDGSGAVVGGPYPAQFDPDSPGSTTGALIFRLAGGGAGTRRAVLAPASGTVGVQAVGDLVITDDQDGMPAWKIVTPNVTWWYQKAAGAFSSAVTADGRDWIGWSTTPQFGGEYRGIGQLNDFWFHPGGTLATSQLVSAGPLKVTLESTHVDGFGTWTHRVEIYQTFVRDTFTSVGNRGWWFLYEGTPGGEKVDGSLVDGGKVYRGTAGANPTITNYFDNWQQNLGPNGYVVFAVPAQNRSIFFSHGQSSTAGLKWDGRMTIFGFGRDLTDGSNLFGAGHSFTYGILPTADAVSARDQISSILTSGGGGPGPTTTVPATSTTLSGGGGSNPAPSTGFVAVTPSRLLDTRQPGQGPTPGAGAPRALTVRGRAGVPGDADAVVLNVTATNATQSAFVRVWASGEPAPSTSSINLAAGDTVPNLVTTRVGSDDAVNLLVSDGTADLLVDVVGYYRAATASGGYHPVTPVRAHDTREAGSKTPLGAGGTVDVDVAAALGVPAGQIGGVALNVTVTAPTAGGYVSVFPAGGSVPLVSNLNFGPGQTVANAVVSGVSAGKVRLYNAAGASHVVVDVMGWYGSGGGGARFHPVSPGRALDTRGGSGPVAGDTWVDALVTGPALGVDAGAAAVVANITVTGATAPAFITVWPTGAARPLASIQNTVAGTTRANQATVKVGAGDAISIYNSTGSVHVIADVVGYFI